MKEVRLLDIFTKLARCEGDDMVIADRPQSRSWICAATTIT
jgi:hypothetical protein